MTVLYDCHLHSDFSGDCDTPAELMAEKAVSLGMKGICFTEHLDLDAPVIDGTDFSLDTGKYIQRMEALKAKYRSRLDIRIGVELGMQSHVLSQITGFAAAWPFDFIIASQHYINGGDPYYPSYFKDREERDCYEEFFQIQLSNLKNFSSYDTLGHMDYIVRYGPAKNTHYSFSSYADKIDPILHHLIENGKCLEVNTGGYKHSLGSPNPDTTVLRRYRELGGELITIGSDAHKPILLAYEFEKASALLTDLGFRYYTIYRGRKPEMMPL